VEGKNLQNSRIEGGDMYTYVRRIKKLFT